MAEESTDARWVPPSRARWTEEDGRAMARALARSGETVVAFARRHGLVEQRVHTWKRRFAAEATRSVPFVSVRIKERTKPAAVRGSGLELVLRGGHTVRVGHDFDAALLRRVATVFESEGSC